MISPWRTGVAFGAAVGIFHLAWAGLVAAGWAQAVIDFILGLHFIELSVHVAPFHAGTAVTLVALTSALGAIGGAVFAGLWNWLHDAGAARGKIASAS
jgi:hypothetical protein